MSNEQFRDQQQFLRTSGRWNWANGSEMKGIKNPFPVVSRSLAKAKAQHSTLCTSSSLRAPGLTLRDSVDFVLTLESGQFILFHWSSEPLRSVWNPPPFTLRILSQPLPRPEDGCVHLGAILAVYSVLQSMCLFSSLWMLLLCVSLSRAGRGISPFLLGLLGCQSSHESFGVVSVSLNFVVTVLVPCTLNV